MTKAEKAHLSALSELGCIVCLKMSYGKSPAEIHHLRNGVGIGQRNDHFNAIPLCHKHHRTGGYGVALHAGQKAFEDNYGTERELLDMVENLLK